MSHAECVKRYREAKRLRGECAYCKQPARPDSKRCQTCTNRHRERKAAQTEHSKEYGTTTYIPIEEILSRPGVRVLRQLRWHDWSTAVGLLDVMDVPTDALPRFRVAINDATRRGLVERRDLYGKAEYRITPAGRDALRAAFDSYEQRLGEGVAA